MVQNCLAKSAETSKIPKLCGHSSGLNTEMRFIQQSVVMSAFSSVFVLSLLYAGLKWKRDAPEIKTCNVLRLVAYKYIPATVFNTTVHQGKKNIYQLDFLYDQLLPKIFNEVII